jgi:hypothetical protein
MVDFPLFEGYAGFRENFTFREEAALTIPKRIRELAYSLQVDIEIVSTRGNDYKNFKSSPPFSFYGYAVIVFRDHSQIQIPIEQARQVLYYDRVVEAYTNWWALYLSFVAQYSIAALIENQLDPIAEVLGLTQVPNDVACVTPPAWEELPIREVYIKTKFGTQFKVEVSWFEPVPVTYGECEYDGSSQFTDSPKDEGLPDNGTQPQSASDPLNPYNGLPAPDSAEQLGDFFNIKQGTLDEPNFDNEPDLNQTWDFEFAYSYLDGSGNTLTKTCGGGDIIRLTGLPSDSATVRYNEVLGTNADGSFNRVSLEWKGETVLETFGGGILNGSMQQCSRELVVEE